MIKVWQWSRRGLPNFGDEITVPLIKMILGCEVEKSSLADADLIGAGSTVSTVYKDRAQAIPFIWGAGFMWPGSRSGINLRPSNRILALRGELSLARLDGIERKDVVLGDPGLLADLLIDPARITRSQYVLGLVPHYVDKDSLFFRKLSEQRDTLLIDVERDPTEVIADIARCDAVLSSSLHGLVVSDSLGIPNRRIVVSDRILGASFKFFDYLSIYANRDSRALTPKDLEGLSAAETAYVIQAGFDPPVGIERAKLGLIEALIRQFR